MWWFDIWMGDRFGGDCETRGPYRTEAEARAAADELASGDWKVDIYWSER